MYFIGTPRQSTGSPSIVDNLKYKTDILVGIVKSVDDPQYLGRIKVKVKGVDDAVLDAELPWCFPMIPKLISIQPKIDEGVLVFLMDSKATNVNRLYLGPINSQPQLLNKDPYFFSAWAGFSFGPKEANISVATIPEIMTPNGNGVFPNPQDVSIQGRYNTDITQKDNEVVIRAGKFETTKVSKTNPYPFKFNTKTQGYIQIKNDAVLAKKTATENEYRGTVTNIVSNKINLLTHKDSSPKFNLTNQDNLISDEELLKILEGAHQLAFGDIQLEYLKLIKDAVLNHVHNGNGNPATDLTLSGNKQSVAAFKEKADGLEKAMLSKNIRIN